MCDLFLNSLSLSGFICKMGIMQYKLEDANKIKFKKKKMHNLLHRIFNIY